MISQRWPKKILRHIPAQAGRPGTPDPDLLPENLMANLWPGLPSWDPDSDFLIPALFALGRFIPVRGRPIPIESHDVKHPYSRHPYSMTNLHIIGIPSQTHGHVYIIYASRRLDGGTAVHSQRKASTLLNLKISCHLAPKFCYRGLLSNICLSILE